ncbi:MAG TPA: PilZ domain-containing protein [Vicinamibacteria bacterium]|jgi:hypothetical protein
MSDVKQERRAAPRVAAQGNLPGQLEIDLDTNVFQLSPGGMMVELGMPVDVGSEHAFNLNIDGEDLDLIGVVRNIEPSMPGDPTTSYHIGIQFCDLTDEQQAILTRFVESKL